MAILHAFLALWLAFTAIDAKKFMSSDWIQNAMQKQKEKMKLKIPGDNFDSKKAPPLNRQHPMKDIFDSNNGDDANGPGGDELMLDDFDDMMDILDADDILNEKDYDDNPFENPLEMKDHETQHSFQHPVDMIAQNWLLLGDAVATINFARLTPDLSGRRGAVWNKFGLRLEDWQITLEFNVDTEKRLPGDGFAIWILDENEISRPPQNLGLDASLEKDRILLGDLYGMRRDFNGTGIIFDTYDNDNNGDNPVVYSLVNDGKLRQWNADQDLIENRDNVKKHLKDAASVAASVLNPKFPTECTLDYHGKESVKILLRYQDGQLSVFTDIEHELSAGNDADKLKFMQKHAASMAFGGLGHFGLATMLKAFGVGHESGSTEIPHLCLVRRIDIGVWKNPHIALSAMTGEATDNHDFLKLETKFLRKQHKIQADTLPKTGYKKRNSGVLVSIYWSTIAVFSVVLVCETLFEILMIRNIYTKAQHILSTINRINPFLQCSYLLNVTQYVLLIFAFNWKCILCNSPLLVIRAQKFMTNSVLLAPHTFEQRSYLYSTTYRQFLWVQLGLLSLSAFYHFWRLFHI